jgi:hypothetical protein
MVSSFHEKPCLSDKILQVNRGYSCANNEAGERKPSRSLFLKIAVTELALGRKKAQILT